MTANLGDKERRGEDGHDRHGYHGLADFEADLISEVFGVGEGGVVKDEEVGQGGEDKVDDQAEDPDGIGFP